MPEDDLEAALRRLVVQQQLIDQRIVALERSRVLRAWNQLYRKYSAWRGGVPDLRTPGDLERLLLREQEQPSAVDSSLRFAVSIEGGTHPATLESLKAQTYKNWELANKGDALVTLQAGDRLAPQALHFYAQALARADVAYADEDLLFKPGWSPELLKTTPYLGRAVVRRQTADLTKAVHIPRILYHRAAPPVIEQTAPQYSTPPNARMSVIVCSREPRRVRECLGALRRTTTCALEIIVMHHLGAGGDMRRIVERFGGMYLSYEGSFDFARMNNLAAEKATAPMLVFLNDDVILEQRGWDAAFTSSLGRIDVGAVGAILDYPDGTIQHAGVVIGMGDGAGHCGRFQMTSDLWPWLRMGREVSAVTGAMFGIRTDVFRKLEGFDPTFPVNYNDVDLCLRLRQAGLSVLCMNVGKVVHQESQTRVGGTTYEERDALYKRWAFVLAKPDEFYSPHLSLTERIAIRSTSNPLAALVATR